jgi:hypothetical protein
MDRILPCLLECRTAADLTLIMDIFSQQGYRPQLMGMSAFWATDKRLTAPMPWLHRLSPIFQEMSSYKAAGTSFAGIFT